MKTVPWRLIEEGRGDGWHNMAADQAALRACDEGKSPPTLRLYGWERPTLSLGYSQNALRQIDRGRCRDLRIPIVRRPTGGRAVLHDRELTYSVIASKNHPRFPGGLRETFQTISSVLLSCLDRLGIPAKPVAGADLRLREAGKTAAPACFASAGHFEIAVNQRKLVGSAQRRTKNAFLQHGAILIDLDRERLNSLLLFQDEKDRRSNLEILRRKTTSLNENCARKISFEEVRRAFREGFSQAFSEGLVVGEWSAFELELRRRLLAAAE